MTGHPIGQVFADQEAPLRRRIAELEAKLAKAMEAIDALVIVNGREIGFRSVYNIPMRMASGIERKVRVALATRKTKAKR